MGQGLTIFFIIVTAFISVLVPTIIAAIMIKKYKASWKAFFVGAIVFIVAQPMLRIPILKQLGYTTWFVLFSNSNTVLFYVIIGMSAGIFEEVGRFIGLRFFLKNSLSWENGVVFGLGHGGAEAFLLVGLNYLKMIFNLLHGQTVDSLVNTPSYLFLVGGLERILAITAHIGMTMLVLYSVKYRKKRYLLYAVLFHAMIDSPLPLLAQALKLNVWGSEGYIAIFALIAVLIIVKFKAVLDNDRDDIHLGPNTNE